MKTHLAFILAGLGLLTTGNAQVYQPPSLSSIDPISRAGPNYILNVTLGFRGQSTTTVIARYSGLAEFSRSGFSSIGASMIGIFIPAPLTGSYRLDAIELSDGGGSTIYRRDGTIARALYSASNLPSTHQINLAVGDFAIGGATLPNPETGRAINLSTRGFVGGGDQAMIVGIVVANGARSFLFRAIGPALGGFGVSGFVPNPKIELRNQAGAIIATNDDWPSTLAADALSVGAFALATGSRDAALRARLTAGNYTLVITSADGGTGIALAEAYELP